MEKYLIVKERVKKIKKFNLQSRTIEFKLKPIPQEAEPVSWVKTAIEEIIMRGTEGLACGDKVGFTFCSKDFARGQGWMRLKKAEEVTFDDVWEKISSIYQSNSCGVSTETFCLGVTTVKMPVGRGRGKQYNTFKEECAKRRGIISINNNDNLCLPRALAVAIAHINKDPEYNNIRKDTGKIQTQRTMQLIDSAGVIIPPGGCGIPELRQFQQHLSSYCITVFQFHSKGRDVIFKGEAEGLSLNLLFHEGHFNVITSLTAAFVCHYYCEECNVPYDHKSSHRCGSACFACRQSPSCTESEKLRCDSCNRWFKGVQCFENHLKKKICEKIKRCKECFKTILRDRLHTCGEIFCKICKKHQPSGHLCYIQPDTRSPSTKDFLFIFYDLETAQEKVRADGSILQEPTLCVFKQCCDTCINTYTALCNRCGVRQQILKINPIDRFTEYVLGQRKLFKNVVVLAHNGGGFDHQFILNHILTKTNLTPELIMRGTKLILMSVGNVKFLDSLNYFPMPLSALPKAFGLTELKKGYFPHLFNRNENQNYVGPYPAVEFYDPDNMKLEAREKFLTWYSERLPDDIFDFQKEIVEYCISDVDILTLSCLRFRELMLSEGNVCPFTEACTLPSACNKIYRRNFLQPNTIGIIPKNGYRWRENQSLIAIRWLVWEEKERGINIQHAANGAEALVAGVKVDGFCVETGEVFEFHGCYYHGCSICFTSRRAPLHDDPSETMESRYEATKAKTQRLRSLGYTVTEMWECQLTPEIKSFTHPLLNAAPLNPRDAFYGGRTGNTVEYYKAKEDEQIKYMDVCSLYPYVNKYGKYPIGHPEVIVGEACYQVNLSEISGLVKCRILPNPELFHPVLPTKMNSKLMFVNCRGCGENSSRECNHSEAERALTGTWVVEEIVKALEKGYKILDIFEIWQYKSAEYDKVKKSGGLFNTYISKFLAIKQQASGWPSWCKTEDQKQQYIHDYYEREGVYLDYDKIEHNPGLRLLGKNVITSFWGKLGQKENQPKTSIVNKPSEFFKMLENPCVEVNTVVEVNEDTLIVNWSHTDESYDVLSTVNVCLAAYTTALARLKLYSYLEQLGERVLYYDTDSVIYTWTPGQWDVPVGGFLGEMTNEVDAYGPGSFIYELVSGGPKNYAFRITTPTGDKIICKVKGISLTHIASQAVNFDQIKKMILEKLPPISVLSRQLRRSKLHEVVTVEFEKKYRLNSTKRKFLDDGTSFPYGYKKIRVISKHE